MAIRAGHSTSRNAVTRFEVLERFRGAALVRVQPKTGRTHQFSKDREPDPVPSDLTAIISDIVETVAQRAEEAEVPIRWQPNDSFPKLLFDPEGISRAVLNVVTNAIDAVEKQPDGRVEIAVELNEQQETVQITVRDNGPGIPTDRLPEIFNLFVSTKGARGTGLGLTVSRKILREHGGDISVVSDPATGSTFTLMFPLDLGGRANAESSGTATDAKLPADFDASITP
ncbi:MAG: GHKL domain-containing protein [Planctomycetia bacterium]|nr:GHKL domain-containing protein [Planctomycetia bacterium]